MIRRPPRSTLFPYTTPSDLCAFDLDPHRSQPGDVGCAALGLDRFLDHDFRLLLGKRDRKSTRLNSSHLVISYAVFCLKKKKRSTTTTPIAQPRATTYTPLAR